MFINIQFNKIFILMMTDQNKISLLEIIMIDEKVGIMGRGKFRAINFN